MPIVASIVVLPDGKILIGGQFTSVGGNSYGNVARLNSNGSVDTNFNDLNIMCSSCSSFPPTAMSSVPLQPDGKIIIGGQFNLVGGQTRSFFARLTNDTAASQILSIHQSQIAWFLIGSSPQFTRVIFVNYPQTVLTIQHYPAHRPSRRLLLAQCGN